MCSALPTATAGVAHQRHAPRTCACTCLCPIPSMGFTNTTPNHTQVDFRLSCGTYEGRKA